ncbi:MAG TPA: chemotaxis-specific protein-glutamate methyltransferase CheB [Patescibacteria group bacterium]|nr:chemotaxis-specific protein-glutamate methyltransferase CheB [Patescibacteria group bacterium]
MTSRRRIRTVIVDDSAVARLLLHRVLTHAGDFDVIESVSEGERAVERVATLRPDLVTMDLHLPGIDGVEVTRRIMRRSPTPIAIVAASANLDDATIYEALGAGALTAVQRPLAPGQPDYLPRRRRLLHELRSITQANASPIGEPPTVTRRGRSAATTPAQPMAHRSLSQEGAGSAVALIAIAASTGGPHALRTLLSNMPSGVLPPIVIVQHIADGFSAGLAAWLAGVSSLPVRVAVDGERLSAGMVLVAPDDRHLTVEHDGRVRLLATGAVGGHRPSATVLFESVARTFGSLSVGIVLTGMGRDGADGLLKVRQSGGRTIAEDPATAVVGGMPGAAIALDAADRVLPLAEIGPYVASLLHQRPTTPSDHQPERRPTS